MWTNVPTPMEIRANMETRIISVELSETHDWPDEPDSDLSMVILCDCSETGVDDRNTSVARIIRDISPSLNDDLAENEREKIPS